MYQGGVSVSGSVPVVDNFSEKRKKVLRVSNLLENRKLVRVFNTSFIYYYKINIKVTDKTKTT